MKHGANIYKYAKKLRCHPHEIVDFSSNINSYHPDIDIKLSQEMLVNYGDSSYKNLKQVIASKYEIKKKQIALFNGATATIFELFKSLKNNTVYLYAPLYGEYEKAAKQTSKKIIKINRLKHLEAIPAKNSIVTFVNPSTPEAKFYDLQKLFSIWEKRNCTIILDESFLEFESLKSMVNQINNYNKLYIIKSFTKFHSCGGIRVGALFSSKENIQKFQNPLWHLSSFDTEFLTQRLQDKVFEKRSKNLHTMHKKELYEILKASKLFKKIYTSDANFFLTKSKNAPAIFKQLLEQKILVRTCESFDFLTKNYVRFAVKDTYAHVKLEKALRNIYLKINYENT
ncbi:aminotransferase class I/II-fold pyridoxal phosphate-dependent enzyme [Sulfurimonas sp. SAG-AH-194-I05]|nr:aminotransferase class I/II-fold pyridoxal phosphate-dependent enzyme [Sulfurimonas sp. SAG-AH-194-I05]MDF1875323.1 aminotransferase class I/II-fold pyridoxal phosphate-dependent enzyme [Sulfurimonas sp. SAG-AH-194-I05]